NSKSFRSKSVPLNLPPDPTRQFNHEFSHNRNNGGSGHSASEYQSVRLLAPLADRRVDRLCPRNDAPREHGIALPRERLPACRLQRTWLRRGALPELHNESFETRHLSLSDDRQRLHRVSENLEGLHRPALALPLHWYLWSLVLSDRG